MKGGINKMMRNLAASVATGSEFEKKLFKATYHGDMKEPKEKHVVFIEECFADEHKSIVRNEDAMKLFIDRHRNKVNEFVTNTKSFIILHRCLNNNSTSNLVAQKLSQSEKEFGYFSIIETTSDDLKMMQELYKINLSSLYSKYVKSLAKSMVQFPIVRLNHEEADKTCKNMNTSKILENFEGVNFLITQIISIMNSLGIEGEMQP